MLKLGLLFEEEKRPRRLFCDMDGVLTDFDGRFKELTGLFPLEYRARYSIEEFWSAITEEHETFWSGMKWTREGKILWRFIRKHSPTLLTAPSREKSSRTGKLAWVERNLSPVPKVIFKGVQHKQEVSGPGKVLIDDRPDVLDLWRSKGGIGILCPNNGSVEGVLRQLRELGYE